MANGFCVVMVNGTLGADPEIRYTNDGKAVANFTAVTKEKWKDNEKSEWHRFVAFGKTAETIGQYMKKGQNHTFIGKLQTRKWEKDGVDRYTTEVVVREFHFGNNPRSAPEEQPKDHVEPAQEGFDDIPF